MDSSQIVSRRSLLWGGATASMALLGRQVLCVVNFAPRQIGKHQSQVLTLGVPDESGNVVLLLPDRDVPLGGRLY